jgi:hypothetical protein
MVMETLVLNRNQFIWAAAFAMSPKTREELDKMLLEGRCDLLSDAEWSKIQHERRYIELELQEE